MQAEDIYAEMMKTIRGTTDDIEERIEREGKALPRRGTSEYEEFLWACTTDNAPGADREDLTHFVHMTSFFWGHYGWNALVDLMTYQVAYLDSLVPRAYRNFLGHVDIESIIDFGFGEKHVLDMALRWMNIQDQQTPGGVDFSAAHDISSSRAQEVRIMRDPLRKAFQNLDEQRVCRYHLARAVQDVEEPKRYFILSQGCTLLYMAAIATQDPGAAIAILDREQVPVRTRT